MTEFIDTVTVQDNGKNSIRAVIPKPAKERLGLSPGDKVFIYLDGDRLILTKKAIMGADS